MLGSPRSTVKTARMPFEDQAPSGSLSRGLLLLSIIDIHLVLRGADELLFTGLAVVSGALVNTWSRDQGVPA